MTTDVNYILTMSNTLTPEFDMIVLINIDFKYVEMDTNRAYFAIPIPVR
jgi:hypothetical protein